MGLILDSNLFSCIERQVQNATEPNMQIFFNQWLGRHNALYDEKVHEKRNLFMLPIMQPPVL